MFNEFPEDITAYYGGTFLQIEQNKKLFVVYCQNPAQGIFFKVTEEGLYPVRYTGAWRIKKLFPLPGYIQHNGKEQYISLRPNRSYKKAVSAHFLITTIDGVKRTLEPACAQKIRKLFEENMGQVIFKNDNYYFKGMKVNIKLSLPSAVIKEQRKQNETK